MNGYENSHCGHSHWLTHHFQALEGLGFLRLLIVSEIEEQAIGLSQLPCRQPIIKTNSLVFFYWIIRRTCLQLSFSENLLFNCWQYREKVTKFTKAHTTYLAYCMISLFFL